MLRVLPFIIFALTVPGGQAQAAWLPAGSPVCAPCDASNPVVASDGAGGVFVVWEQTHIYAQHLTANGDPAPGWPATGLPVCTAALGQGGPSVLADGAGGFFAAWTDFRNNAVSQGDIYALHMQGDGTLAPGWPVNGVPVTQEPGLDNANGGMALDGNGGVFVIWVPPVPPPIYYTLWAQHLDVTGPPVPGWPSNGLIACSQFVLGTVSVVGDGTGGAVLAWGDGRRGGYVTDGTFDVYGLRLSAEGALAPGWTPNGNLLAPGEWTAILLPDRAGGFLLASANPSPYGFDANYYVHRFTLDGTSAPGWPAGGVVACAASGDRWGLLATADSVGGVLMDWYDYRLPGDDVYGSRVLPNATVAPGWPANGLRVSDPGQPNEFNFGLAPDGTGGAYLSWEDDSYSPAISFIQHITADGAVAPGWPQYGFRLSSTCSQYTPQAVPDGAGGAIAVWQEQYVGCARFGLFAQRFAPAGPYPVPVLVSLVSAAATPERVELIWSLIGEAGLSATVERMTASNEWQVVGNAGSDGAGQLRYVDRTVAPGTRYAYRLAYEVTGNRAHSAESWVNVPAAAQLALAGFQPNPALGGDPKIAFSLPSAEPATVELLDVAGRRLLAQEVGSVGAGSHLMRLDTSPPLQPGIYWLRLQQAGHRLLAKGIVSR